MLNRYVAAMDASARQKRVAFVIAHLGPGGAQRVVTTAANAFVERGLDVHIITTLDDHPDAYELDPRVKRYTRGARPSWRAARPVVRAAAFLARPSVSVPLIALIAGILILLMPRLLNYVVAIYLIAIGIIGLAHATFGAELILAQWLRRTIRTIAPDAVLSFLTQTNVLTVLATRGLRTRTVISERNDPRRQKNRWRVELVRRLVYRWADLVTANTYGALGFLENFVPRRKLAFLPNPLMLSRTGAARLSEPTAVTVTRLVDQKGLDVLLRAWAKASAVVTGWRLAIVGDGPLREELQALARELQIAEQVDWLGHVADPVAFLKAAKFFVLTSRFEGSPNALLEAMACGLPSIVTDASPGPLELIGDEEAGLIVPVEDVDATARAIERLAGNQVLRVRLGSAALGRSKVHQLDRAIQTWLELLDCA